MHIQIKFTDGTPPEVYSTEDGIVSSLDVTHRGGFLIVKWEETREPGKPFVKCSTAYPAHRVLLVDVNGAD